MHLYEIHAGGTVEAAIPVETAPEGYQYVALGSAGRGRRLAKVPLAERLAANLSGRAPCPNRGRTGIWQNRHICQACGMEMPAIAGTTDRYDHPTDAGEVVVRRPLTRASILRTKAKGTLLLVEERDAADARALVVIRDQSGFRGGWELAGGVEPCPGTFEAHGCSVCASWSPPHRDRSLPVPAGIVLADGYCAQGLAGRAGGGAEYLCLLSPGQELIIRRSGRLYGGNARLVARWDGERLRCLPPQEFAAQEAAQGEEGEAL